MAKARFLFTLLPLVALAGCKAAGPDFARPQTPSGNYSGKQQSGDAPVAVPGQGPQQRWWQAFGSSELDALVEKALAGNQSLEASRETLNRSREYVKAAMGRSLPQVDAHAQVNHQQINLSSFGLGGAGFGNPEFTLYSLGGGVSYDLDLFGGQKRATERAVADAETQLRETEAAHLTIAGRVVLQVLTIAALNDRIATQQALVEEDRRNVRLTEAKRRGGEGTMVEVLSAQGELAADQSALPQLEQQRAEARNLLAALLGIAPSDLGATDFTLASLHLPKEVPVTLASELVHKRPDILASEARLHSAVAGIGVATARLYPNVTLGASFLQSTTRPEDIFNTSNTGFSMLGGLTAPIFHGGTLKAEKRAAEAEARAAAARYRQTVLEAFAQTSDLLAALANDTRTVSLRGESLDIAERSLHLSRRSFQVGNSGVLQVLDASRAAQQARLAMLDARSRQFLNVARLYLATAGGWTEPEKPAP
ncbi:efflux transporter outer membrane subunit [Novosphingobium sp. TH158]|uniref:efflux transporter outer membrane subunit n=1 Tax=Novosphingobium sp. TH158 TaxID=2067455 RepID=UPI000C7AC7EC|nr:efflux transporter outer membrane subunit [Novosphingobium sp. TH158]PLK25761.1 RND transporter [Novosphingobium sp. TH158]